jgi:hypothetical protein
MVNSTGCLARAAVAAFSITFLLMETVSAASSWQYGSAGGGRASASLYSSNAITTGARAIDFHPLLTLSCDAGRPGIWRQSVRVQEPLSSGPSIEVQVRIDQGGTETQSWALGQKNRALVLDSASGMARLLRATRLRVAWPNGFFGEDGEGVFDVRGAADVIARLAKSCGVGLPAR